jgi:hypothetical protein
MRYRRLQERERYAKYAKAHDPARAYQTKVALHLIVNHVANAQS